MMMTRDAAGEPGDKTKGCANAAGKPHVKAVRTNTPMRRINSLTPFMLSKC
jgi:hypothetical protein